MSRRIFEVNYADHRRKFYGEFHSLSGSISGWQKNNKN